MKTQLKTSAWFLTLILAFPLVFSVQAAAGESPSAAAAMPSASDVDSAQAQIRNRLRMPSVREQSQAGQQLPKLPTPRPGEGSVDLEAIARSYDPQRQVPVGEGGPPQEPLPTLAVFVSLGMPEASLKRLIEDAEAAHAVLVLRGLKDQSMHGTFSIVKKLNGQHKTAWRVDPRMFEAFDVQSVPVTLLIDPASRNESTACGAPACAKARHSKVAGDVSLDHALRSIAQADPALSGVAQQHLAMLAKNSFQGGGRP